MLLAFSRFRYDAAVARKLNRGFNRVNFRILTMEQRYARVFNGIIVEKEKESVENQYVEQDITMLPHESNKRLS